MAWRDLCKLNRFIKEMENYIHRAIRVLKNYSFKDALSIIKATLYVNEPYYIYFLNTKYESYSDCQNNGIDIANGSLEEINEFKNALSIIPWEFQCHEHDGVNDFYIARENSVIQHISWLYYNSHHNRLLALGDNEVEVKYCLTLPRYRGRGVYPLVLKKILHDAKAKNINRVFMCVRQKNHPSIRGIEKAGFKRAGTFRLLRILGIQISCRISTSNLQ